MDEPEQGGPAEGGKATGTTYQRRREQVRRAQRTHRDRKAAYVTALQREVEELRAENAAFRADAEENAKVKALEREVVQLRAERAEHIADSEIVQKLKALLNSHGVDLSYDFWHESARAHMAITELRGNTRETQQIHVNLPTTTAGSSENGNIPSNTPYETVSSVQTPLVTTATQFEGDTDREMQLVCNDGFDGTQTGIDFVLALEHVCLHHHKFSSPELLQQGYLGSGHAQMLSSPVMARVPSATTSSLHIPLQSGCQWNVPVAELENLLSLSQLLDLEGEATPIQIWQRVSGHPQFWELTHERLNQLKIDLLPHIECHGFGAVVAEARIDEALNNVFVD